MESWDAVETRARLARREVSPREVIDAAVARAEAAGDLGAIVTETFERARRESARAAGPLAGVPTFVKDLADVAGVRIGWGTRAVGEVVSRRSSPTVRLLGAMGLVSLGKSATPELGMTATTEPLAHGPCRNPWDRERSAGGSSGGAAALVAAGVVPIAHASDGGGSIRIPASSCGLVGLKVTRGRLDMEASTLLPINLAVHGVVTRSVRDTVAFWQAVEALRPTRRPIRTPRRPKRLRVGVFSDSPLGGAVSPDVRAAVERAARLCAELGHDVEQVRAPYSVEVIDDFVRYWALLAWLQDRGGRVLVHPSFDRARLEPWTRELSRWCEREPLPLARAVVRLRRFSQRFRMAHDVLVSPVVAHPPPRLGHLAPDLPFDVAMARIREHCPFTGIINALGTPAISLPLGRSAEGLPIGVQFAARAHEEATLLGLARDLEQAAPFATRGGGAG